MADDLKVTYRLGAPYSRALQEQARERLLSPHQYARLVLVNHFERTEALDLQDDIRSLEKALNALRVDFNNALE